MVNVGKREDGLLDLVSAQKRRIHNTAVRLDYWRREYPDLVPVFDDLELVLSVDPQATRRDG